MTIESFQLERTFKGHLIQPLNRDTYSSTSAQSPIQPELGCLHPWHLSLLLSDVQDLPCPQAAQHSRKPLWFLEPFTGGRLILQDPRMDGAALTVFI